MKTLEEKRKNMGGATVVEFALILLPLLLLLLGCMEFGRYFWAQHVLSSAAAEGARMAILSDVTDGEVGARIEQVVSDGGIQATPSYSISARSPGQPITVTVSVPYEVIALGGFVPGMLGVTQVSGSSIMVGQP
ncbi:TadE/TadG family type IV pilus assembly protein [Fundidesulfovibrio soli]|uniref:TadE/TadG family type IV pilus assembly protein n=1 Tax=Fundidesulfovibrio soli TaxID=2922716 RepID=UPI001FAFD498|nr:TadE/TadG family type IV pilus assembly protein [Fundidesulfovibrio soli]